MALSKLKCKTCGAGYHYCTSCDYNIHMNAGYCSEICNVEYSGEAKKIVEFIQSLNSEQFEMFKFLSDNVNFEEHWVIIDSTVKSRDGYSK